MKKQIFNPYLPPWEYIPDGEPRIFDGRLYVFGSHDRFDGGWYCENDYVSWSAPLSDLSEWRYEGVIYTKGQDSREGNLYAPDVIRGLDGRYYLYYSKDDTSVIGVAVCDTPSGKYEFIGEVSYPDGRVVGDAEGEYFMFDPSVLIDNGRIWLYSGSSVRKTTTKIKRNMAGCTVMELEANMITVKKAPSVVLHGTNSWNTEAFFEGPSARRIGDLYYLVYPVRNGSGLHYATSKHPDRGFIHRGRVHSTSDVGINGHTVLDPAYPTGNNHGGLVELNGQWYIFDHRMTNKTQFSRQAVAEPIRILPDGSLIQSEATSCGLNGKPLVDEETYPAYIACHLTSPKILPGIQRPWNKPFITQSGVDGDEDADFYVSHLSRGCTVGYKYFDFSGGDYKLTFRYRGDGGKLAVSNTERGVIIGEYTLPRASDWSKAEISLRITGGKRGLFFTYKGRGYIDIIQFEIKKRRNCHE